MTPKPLANVVQGFRPNGVLTRRECSNAESVDDARGIVDGRASQVVGAHVTVGGSLGDVRVVVRQQAANPIAPDVGSIARSDAEQLPTVCCRALTSASAVSRLWA